MQFSLSESPESENWFQAEAWITWKQAEINNEHIIECISTRSSFGFRPSTFYVYHILKGRFLNTSFWSNAWTPSSPWKFGWTHDWGLAPLQGEFLPYYQDENSHYMATQPYFHHPFDNKNTAKMPAICFIF